MSVFDVLGTRVILDGPRPTPPPYNDNRELMAGCDLTPAEVMQWARRRRERLSRELADDPGLWRCPEHRRTWNATLGIEKLTLWKCYGIWGA